MQAEYILDMQLSRLTRLGRTELEEEMAKLRETIAELEAILGSDEKLRSVIKTELGEIRDKFATDRKSQITFDTGDIDIEDLIDDEDLIVTLSAKGYVKTMPADTFRTQGRGGRGVAGAKLRDEDYVTQILTTTAHAYLLFFSNRGRVYRLKAHEIPMKERTARGTAIVNLLQLQPEERIQAIIDTRDYETNRFLFFATKQGPGQEDEVQRVRLVAAHRPHRHQPARRRRAREGHPDQRRRRHPHGDSPRPGHPLQRGRRSADGPRRGRCPGHEDARRATRSCRSTPAATTWRC